MQLRFVQERIRSPPNPHTQLPISSSSQAVSTVAICREFVRTTRIKIPLTRRLASFELMFCTRGPLCCSRRSAESCLGRKVSCHGWATVSLIQSCYRRTRLPSSLPSATQVTQHRVNNHRAVHFCISDTWWHTRVANQSESQISNPREKIIVCCTITSALSLHHTLRFCSFTSATIVFCYYKICLNL